MSVTVRPYRRGGWEVDIRVELPDHTEHRQRRRSPVSSKSAAQRWGEAREREWYAQLTNPRPVSASVKEVPTLAEFATGERASVECIELPHNYDHLSSLGRDPTNTPECSMTVTRKRD